MKLNKKLIKKLSNGEIAVYNSGTVEQLREVLKSAFPKCGVILPGGRLYYSRSSTSADEWTAWLIKDKNRPTFKISDFYQPELFTGWAKDDKFTKFMFYFKDDVPNFGFEAFFGAWVEGGELNYSEDQYNRPATHEEIESTLIKEAKRRGYKGGNTIKGIHRTTHTRYEIISFTYDADNDRLLTDVSCVVYEAGQWAEIIEQPEPLPKFSKGGLVSELDLKPEPLPRTSAVSKAKEIHNAYSDYKQLLKQKESIREALRECNTRIQEAENNLIKIINS